MVKKFIFLSAIYFFIFFISISYPCNKQRKDSVNIHTSTNSMLNVFLDCNRCNFKIIQSKVPFVNYVRDPNQAQIHVLITRQSTASGGYIYNLQFIGLGKYHNQDQNLSYSSLQSDTDVERQEGIAKILTFGLLRYVAQTGIVNNINISFDNENINNLPQQIKDPWDHWIFDIRLKGGLESEENNSSARLEGSINGNRVTEDWRFRNGFDYVFKEENFKDSSGTIISTVKSWDGKSSIVKSFSSHWSAGAFVDLHSSTYKNINLDYSIYPGIEYNIFPWSDVSRKILTFGYYLGYKNFNYINKTIFDKLNESLLFHSARVEADIKEPWGDFYGLLDFSQYPNLNKKYKISMEAFLDIRLTEGLSLSLDFQGESIHNQIYLPRGVASLEEILLKQRQLQTSYTFQSSVGIKYTFGSIYNNIINIRM
ncbi:MAG: DUF481 domain-containing protein [Ignavibacteriaceae bacterium]